MSAPARHPYRLTDARQLAAAEPAQHVADLVRLVLLTGANERLHRPEFGAGLGAALLFEPLDPALATGLEMRARGSLEAALGDRIDVLAVVVERTAGSQLEARVEYQPKGSTERLQIQVGFGGE